MTICGHHVSLLIIYNFKLSLCPNLFCPSESCMILVQPLATLCKAPQGQIAEDPVPLHVIWMNGQSLVHSIPSVSYASSHYNQSFKMQPPFPLDLLVS